jgi:predicted exporter
MVVAGYLVPRLVQADWVDTDLFALLPNDEAGVGIRSASATVTERLGRNVVFVLQHEHEAVLLSAASRFEQELYRTALFSRVDARVDTNQWRSLFAELFSFRSGLLSVSTRDLLHAQDMQAVADRAMAQLYAPAWMALDVARDPYGFYTDYAGGLLSSSRLQRGEGGWLLHRSDQNIRSVVIRATLHRNAFDDLAQRELDALLQTQQRVLVPVKLLVTGVAPYAMEATAKAKSEVNVIGLGSIVGVVLLFLCIFRSLAPLLYSALFVGVGILLGLAAVLTVFGSIHVFALVFGSTLIGISIDYAIHLLCVFSCERVTPYERLQDVIPALVMALFTTLAGFGLLGVAPFPGLQQIALFAIVGLIGVWTGSVLFYPVLFRTPPMMYPRALKLVTWVTMRGDIKFPSYRVLLGVGMIAMLLLLLSFSRANDDVRLMQPLSATLKAQESAIRQILGAGVENQYYLIQADSPEILLQREESLRDGWRRTTGKDARLALSQWVPSMQRQEENRQLVDRLYAQNLSDFASELGLNAAQIAAIRREQQAGGTLRFEAIENQLPTALQDLWLGMHEGYFFSAVMPPANTDLSNVPLPDGVRWIDPASQTSVVFAKYRWIMVWLLLAAYFVNAFLLRMKHSWRDTAMMLLVPLMASAVAVTVVALLGYPISLFHMLALALILGFGTDYVIFFAAAHQNSRVGVAVMMSMISTVLSFGLLSLSETPALRAFGMTLLVGILMAYVGALCFAKNLGLGTRAHG